MCYIITSETHKESLLVSDYIYVLPANYGIKAKGVQVFNNNWVTEPTEFTKKYVLF